MHFLQCHKCIVVNENAWKIKHNILFPPAYGYRLLLFRCWVVSNTLQPHGQQHTRVPCPSLFLGVCSNSCPLSQRCHPTILSSFVLFLTCLPSFPASGSFSMSHFFISGGQSIGASASSSVLPRKNQPLQGWFPLGLTGWSPCGTRVSQQSSPEPQFKSISSSALSLICGSTVTLVHDYWENHRFDYMDFFSKVMSLLFNVLSMFVITPLPRSKHFLISWLQSPSAVILELKSVIVSTISPYIAIKWWDRMPWS